MQPREIVAIASSGDRSLDAPAAILRRIQSTLSGAIKTPQNSHGTSIYQRTGTDQRSSALRWLDVVSTPVPQAWRMSLIEDADPGAAQLVEASTTALWFRIGSYRSSRNVVQGFFDYGSGVRPLALGQGEGARYERDGYIDGTHGAYFVVR